MILVDRTSITHPEHPVLILDLFDPSSQAFRALPSTVQFAGAVDEEGVFRGFPTY